MTMADFFEALGAPLKNVRWSWVARRASDNAVFLRAWKDDCRPDGSSLLVKISEQESGSRPGWKERQEHIASIDAGCQCFIVMCEAVDVSAVPRAVATFDDRRIRVAGETRREQGEVWIRIAGEKSIWDVRAPRRST